MTDQNEQRSSLVIEQALFGGVFIAGVADARRTGLAARHFSIPGHRTLWRALERLDPVHDPPSVVDDLTTRGEIERVGGVEYVAELLDAVPTEKLIGTHARRVIEHAVRRAVADRLRGALERMEAGTEGGAAVVDALTRDLRSIGRDLRASTVQRIERAAVNLDARTQPAVRRWLAGSEVAGWLPAGRLAMLTGEGGAGKSRLALQLAVAVAGETGAEAQRVFPSDRRGAERAEDVGPEVSAALGAVAMIGWEDEADEAQRRLRWLADGGLISASATGSRLHYLDAAEADSGALWAAPERFAPATWTDFGHGVLDWLERIDELRLAIIDPLAAAFGDNENDRAAVRAFLTALNAWAARTGVAVLIVAHPPKTAATYSGSTDWRNGVRALWTLSRERAPGFEAPKGNATHSDGWALTLDKSSYGRAGARVWLRAEATTMAGRTTGLLWRECRAEDSAAALARTEGRELSARKAKASENGRRSGRFAPGELGP